MTSFKVELEVHLPGEAKPRKLCIPVDATDDVEAHQKGKEMWANMAKPMSVKVAEATVETN